MYRKVNGKTNQMQPVVTIITQPMLLVPVQPSDPTKPFKPRDIQPKPVSQKPVSHRSSSDIITKHFSDNHGSEEHLLTSIRQDALIQTDIYGIDTLSLSKNEIPGHRTMYGRNVGDIPEQTSEQTKVNSATIDSHIGASERFAEGNYGASERNTMSQTNKIKPTQKKQYLLKRRSSLARDPNSTSSRRKKMKSTTGIQTSASFTRKKGAATVIGTQTTGDYIIETALRHANIQTEKKTVGSQVTPQKALKYDALRTSNCGNTKLRPVLVDFFSQVKQQNIHAEMSDNLAESQTMTDLPPSISTQTLQSYLVNLQEKHCKNTANVALNEISNGGKNDLIENGATNDGNNELIKNGAMNGANRKKCRKRCRLERNKHIVQIYDKNLDTALNYVMPENTGQLQGRACTSLESGSQAGNDSPMYTAVALEGVRMDTPTCNINHQPQFSDVLNTNMERSAATNFTFDHANIDPSSTSSSTSLLEENYFTKHSHTSDIGAQTMSASEFELLLQSSGICVHNTDFLLNPGQNQSLASHNQVSESEPNDLANDLDFLGKSAETIDMNTQTADFSLLESFVPIDSNTQTVGEDLDFFDMVMTNMETQTLNDADLVSLGLLDVPITNTTQSSSSGTDVGRIRVGTGVSTNDSFTCEENESLDNSVVAETGSQISPKTTFTGTCFNAADLTNRNVTDSGGNLQVYVGVAQSRCNLVDEKVQTETQTVTLDVIEPLLQTETQTQVESTDTDFETMNIETQTTFDDLQQLCDWLS